MSYTLSFVPSVFYRMKKRHRNIAYNQQSGHLLCRPGEGVNNGHNIKEQLVFTWGELEHTGKQTAGAHSQEKGDTDCILQCTPALAGCVQSNTWTGVEN